MLLFFLTGLSFEIKRIIIAFWAFVKREIENILRKFGDGERRIATGAVRPRNDNSQEVWRGRTGSSAPTDAFRKCVGEGLCPSRGRGRTPPLRRTEKIVCDCFGIYINKKNERKKK